MKVATTRSSAQAAIAESSNASSNPLQPMRHTHAENPLAPATFQHQPFNPMQLLEKREQGAAGIVQYKKLLGERSLKDDFRGYAGAAAVADAARNTDFDKYKASIKTVHGQLKAMEAAQNAILQTTFKLAPSADNPITRLMATLQAYHKKAKETPKLKYGNYDAFVEAEKFIEGIDDETEKKNSFDHEKGRVLPLISARYHANFDDAIKMMSETGDLSDPAVLARYPAEDLASVNGLKAVLRVVHEQLGIAYATKDFAELKNVYHQFNTLLVSVVEAGGTAYSKYLDAKDFEVVGAAEVPTPSAASNFRVDHILLRHRRDSPAAGAGKFSQNEWDGKDGVEGIKDVVIAARNAGVVAGPIENEESSHPRGRFEITHDFGAGHVKGTSINGAASTTVRLIISRSGKTVVTAFPV